MSSRSPVSLSRLFRALTLLLLASAMTARPADVQVLTRGGRDYSGRMRWELNGLSVVDADAGLRVRIPWVEVRSLSIRRDVESPVLMVSHEEPELAVSGLPVPWESWVISPFPLDAQVFWRDAGFRIESRAAVLGRDQDACRFVYQKSEGDREIVARIGRCSPSHPEARAGLMFRAGLEPSSPAVFFGASAGQGDVFEWRQSAGESMVSQASPPLPGVRWYKLRRDGDVFSAYRSRDGIRWLLAGRTNVSLGTAVQVGVAGAGVTDYRLHTAVFEHVDQARRLRSLEPVRAELVSGSVVECGALEFEGESVRFSGVQSRPAIRRAHLSRLVFQPVPGRLDARLRLGQPGVLLTSGEFVEGEVRRLVDGVITLDSVLTGVQELDVVNQVIAVVFRPVLRTPASCEVRMQDGSVWRAVDAGMEGASLWIQEPALGLCRIPLPDIAAFSR